MPDACYPQHISLHSQKRAGELLPEMSVTRESITTGPYYSRQRPRRLPAFPTPNLQAVDEASAKEVLVHMLFRTFPQVRALLGLKLFLYPQLGPQTVHKQEQVMHRLSTGVEDPLLGRDSSADYRCVIPEFWGGIPVFPMHWIVAATALFSAVVDCPVDNLCATGITGKGRNGRLSERADTNGRRPGPQEAGNLRQ